MGRPVTTPNLDRIGPQPGPQERILSTPADVAVFGGAAGGGKSYALLLEPLRHVRVPGFGATIFRRTRPQITSQGGIWQDAGDLYPRIGGHPNLTHLSYMFAATGGGRSQVRFSHLQHESSVYDYHSAQIPMMGFDELTHFTERQFWYMLSRNRSACGVRPYVRATCNPDADSWVAGLVSWWIDPDSGYAIPERSGVVRWFVRKNDRIDWADSKAELLARHPDEHPLSFTFVPAKLADNKLLMAKDPGYIAKLGALSLVDRERLLGGNWKVRAEAGKVFHRGWFPIVDAVPAGGDDCRYWDLAATEKKVGGSDPDSTAGVLMRRVGGVYYVLDVVVCQEGPALVEQIVRNTAAQDNARSLRESARYRLRWEREPGSAGKRESARMVQSFAGFDAREVITGPGGDVPGDKVARARALSAQAVAGNVKLLRGDWNEMFLREMHGFPDRPHDDVPDAASGAFNALPAAEGTVPPVPARENRGVVARAPAGVFRRR